MKKTKNHINSISNLPLPDIRTATDELARRLCEEQASRPEASGAKVVTKQSLYLDLEYASNTVPRDFLNEEEIAALQNSTAFILRLAMTKNDEEF